MASLSVIFYLSLICVEATNVPLYVGELKKDRKKEKSKCVISGCCVVCDMYSIITTTS